VPQQFADGVGSAVPWRLRAEHLDQPLGIGERRPRLSWLLPSAATAQYGYRLAVADGSDTGWMPGSDSVLVPWPFAPLGSSARVTVRVAVRTDLGESPFSAPLTVEAGLLSAADWVSSWVSPVEQYVAPAGRRPAHELRGYLPVAAGRPVARARLYATAHGLYEVFIGGVRVGDQELTPGFTQYGKRLQVQAYDVTELLSRVTTGSAEVTVLLSDGWWRGQVGTLRSSDQWGTTTAFLGQFHVWYADGAAVGSGTGPSWESRPSRLLAADLIEGQRTDLRLVSVAGTGAGWRPVLPGPAEPGFGRLTWSPAPPVRRVQELRPVSVTRIAPGRQVIDLGQNINGWVRLADAGPAGTEVTLTHGEWLGPDGDVTVEHLAELVRAAGTHLRTGFLSTPYLLPVLADHGHADLAYEPLLRDTPPSWLAMIDRGATTVWESWEGVDSAGQPHESLNHYSKGAVIDFLHRYTAGIRLAGEPAYRSFVIEPVPGGGLTSASAAHRSPYGLIGSSWELAGEDRLRLTVRVPPGTTATVLVNGTETAVGPGRHEFT